MRRLLSTTLLLLFAICSAFSADLSEFQKKAYEEISIFLKEEGFSPSIDSDGTLSFKKEGVLHWIYVNKNRLFISVNRGGFKIGGEDGYKYDKSIYAANKVNKDLSVVKVYCTESSAKVSYELYAKSLEDFKYIFYKSIELLDSARNAFIEAYQSDDQIVTAGSFVINDIKCANVNNKGEIISKYGDVIYDFKTMYIKPSVTFTSKITTTATMFIKFITPTGLSTSESSPSGYSFKQDVSLTEGKTETFYFSGWGANKAGHWKAGNYKWEFWYNGVCIGTKEFKISKLSVNSVGFKA